MEVREELRHHPEPESRRDVDPRAALPHRKTVVRPRRLQRPNDSRADRKHGPALPHGSIDHLLRFLRHRIFLFMHVVLFDLRASYWKKSPQSDVERDLAHFGSALLKFLQKLPREMKPSGRRGG